MTPAPLPIDPVLPDLTAALRQAPCAVLRAPTGSGKTTRVPGALLDAGLAGAGRIVLLEPRRLAARAAAARIAFERGATLGGDVGYHVRLDKRFGPRTRLVVVTEGILLRWIQDDPFLETTGAVVFDEFHERNLDGDLALALCRKIQLDVRPELRLLAMSATLDAAPLRAFLGGCPLVESSGQAHDVDLLYRPRRPEAPLARSVAGAVDDALDRTSGNVLVFLPGVGEIRQAHDELRDRARRRDLEILELYGDLPPEEQDAALTPSPRRRIVLSTNVAESSVTLAGISAVVDTGVRRVLVYDPASGLDRLELGKISKSSAAQRAGRAGREGPGTCLRLWSELEQRALEEAETPEVARVDVTGAVLQLRAFGEADPAAFPWFEAPPRHMLERADALLTRLGALDGARLTPLGLEMAAIPAQPRIARLLLEGRARGAPREAALAAALLSERSPLRPPREAAHESPSDLLDQIHALQRFEERGRAPLDVGELHAGAARGVLRVRDQYARLLGVHDASSSRPSQDIDTALLRSIFAAYADRLCRRRETGGRRAVMVGGRGARLAPSSAVGGAELFVALDVDAGATEALVRTASAVERAWLPEARLRTAEELSFDTAARRVVAKRVTYYDDLPLTEARVAPGDAAAAEALLLREVLADPERALPLDNPDVSQALARIRCLRAWMPELGLAEPRLEDLAAAACVGRASFEETRKAPLLDFLRATLTHIQRRALDTEAPERLVVPSGSAVRLTYEAVKPPVLAVRIQELFGLRETPRVAAGRVAVLLHLLAPNGRPQQVTTDLTSFWNTTYASIRKELRARYPRHAWPEDPRTAPAERRPKRRPS